jgi:RimJ/RimL family protein N-acetyltransferase
MTDPNFYIETPHLFLSYFIPTNPKHCSFLVTLYNSPLFIASEGKTEIVNQEKARERIIGRFVEEHKRHGYGTYLVSLKTTPTTTFSEAPPIGSVSLTRGLSPEALPIPDIGFAIIPEMNGRGYATESAQHLLEHVKREKGLNEVFGFCDPESARSKRVMEKLGMQRQGIWKLSAFGDQLAQVFMLPGMAAVESYGIGEAVGF